jgi:hypothetical protein
MFCLLTVVLKSQLNCKLQQGLETVDNSALCGRKASWATLQKYNLIEQFISYFASSWIKDHSFSAEQTFNSSTTGQRRVGFHENTSEAMIGTTTASG